MNNLSELQQENTFLKSEIESLNRILYDNHAIEKLKSSQADHTQDVVGSEIRNIKDKLIKTEHLLKLSNLHVKKNQLLITDFIKSREEERYYIANQLHESLGQLLYAVKLNLSRIDIASASKVENLAALEDAHKLLLDCISFCRDTAKYLSLGTSGDFIKKPPVE